MPKITCITTTYNEGALLLSAVRSVLGQSFRDFEYLIVDDGSSEETLELLETLSDPRLTIIRQANAGLSAARNVGIGAATGDFICFLDADDLRPNWSFAAIAKVISASDPDLILCPGVLQDKRGQIRNFYDTPIFENIANILPQGVSAKHEPWHLDVCSLAQRIEPQSANKVLRRDLVQATGLHFPEPFFFEDIFFHTLAIAKANRIAFLDCPAFTYFQRYQRPQITDMTGVRRFDILAVTKITLSHFSTLPEFQNTPYRTSVLESCLKLIDWCELSIAHQYRSEFRKKYKEMILEIKVFFKEMEEILEFGKDF